MKAVRAMKSVSESKGTRIKKCLDNLDLGTMAPSKVAYIVTHTLGDLSELTFNISRTVEKALQDIQVLNCDWPIFASFLQK